MEILFRKDIDKMFTEKVMEFLNNGYIVNTNSFGGSDGTLRVDLLKDNHFIRVFIDNNSNGFKLCIAEKYFTEKYELNSTIIWLESLNVVFETYFYEIARDNVFVKTKKEYEDWYSMHLFRIERKKKTDKEYNLQKGSTILLPLINRQKGYKSKKIKNIIRIQRLDKKVVVYFDNKDYLIFK